MQTDDRYEATKYDEDYLTHGPTVAKVMRAEAELEAKTGQTIIGQMKEI